MRGAEACNEALLSTVRLEDFVPAKHPLRPIRQRVNESLAKMDAKLSTTYEADVNGGRPSIAPERLMRATPLHELCSMRSGRRREVLRGAVGEARSVEPRQVVPAARKAVAAWEAVRRWRRGAGASRTEPGVAPRGQGQSQGHPSSDDLGRSRHGRHRCDRHRAVSPARSTRHAAGGVLVGLQCRPTLPRRRVAAAHCCAAAP